MTVTYIVCIGILLGLLLAVIVLKWLDARGVIHLTEEEQGRGLEQERRAGETGGDSREGQP